MGNVVKQYNEKDLFIYLQKVRLETAKRLNDSNIENNKVIKEDKLTFKGAANNVKNFFKRAVGNYNKKEEQIGDQLDIFNKSNPVTIDEATARGLAFSLFIEDNYGLAKLIFASTIVLDDEYKYKYVEQGLEEASSILYGNRQELITIKKQLETNYSAISPNSLSTLQKGLLLGAAATALAGVVIMPVLLAAGAGASAAATTAALAAHGFGDMQIGVGVVALESFILGAAITGIAYGGMKLYNSAKIKKEFLSLSPEANALYLAIQCTYIERVKKVLTKDEFKEQLDTILKNLNVLKGDLDYYLFVENETTKENKSKVKSFHEFDNRLVKVLGIW